MRAPSSLELHGRFARYLLWEFRWPLAVFVVLVLFGGVLFDRVYGRHDWGYAESCYAVILLIFLQADLDSFPDEWYLQPAYFLLPIVGLGVVTESLIKMAYLVFARKRNLPEWQEMVASLFRNHIVVVGAGRVGLRIIKGLAVLGEQVVAIERNREAALLDEVQDLGVPVIFGDGRNRKTLEQAGVIHARAIILASDDDLTNLDAALTARDINPPIRVVMRLFDDTLADKVGPAFQMPAISTSQVAAPAFIAAATGRKVYHDFHLGDQHLHLIDVTVAAGGNIAGRTVGDVQTQHGVNIVMLRGPRGVEVNPGHDVPLALDDTILVIAPMPRLRQLEAANQPATVPLERGS
jgi:Trk K+ transport system NAD-binding subunit